MNKTVKWFLLGTGGLVLAVFLVLLVLPYILSMERLREPIVKRLSTALNRDVSMGALRLSFAPWVGLRVADLRIQDKEPAEGEFILAEEFEIRIRILPLFRGEVRVAEAVLNRPSVTVIRLADGRLNVSDLLTSKKEPVPEDKTVSVWWSGMLVSELMITDGTVFYIDRTNPSPIPRVIKNIGLSLSNISIENPFDYVLSFRIGETPGGYFSIGGEVVPDVSNQSLAFKENRIQLDSFEWTMEGVITELGSIPELNLGIRGRDMDLEKISPVAAVLAVPLPPDLVLGGTADLDIVVKGPIENLILSSTASLDNSLIAYGGFFEKQIGQPAEVIIEGILSAKTVDALDLTVNYSVFGRTGLTSKAPFSLSGVGDLNFSDEVITLNQTRMKIDSLEVDLAGHISNFRSDPEWDLTLTASRLTMEEASGLADLFAISLPGVLNIEGFIDCLISFNGPSSELALSVALELGNSHVIIAERLEKEEGTRGTMTAKMIVKSKTGELSPIIFDYSFEQLIVRDHNLSFSLEGRAIPDLARKRVKFQDNRATIKDILLEFEGMIQNLDQTPIFDMRFKSPHLPLKTVSELAEELGTLLPPGLVVDGVAGLESTIRGNLRELEASGTLYLDQSRLGYGTILNKGEDLSGRLVFKGIYSPESLEIQDLTLYVASSSLTLRGKVITTPHLDVRLSLTSDRIEGGEWFLPPLTVIEVARRLERNQVPSPSGKPVVESKPSRIHLDINIKQAVLRGFPLSNIHGFLAVDQNILTLFPLMFEIGGGTYDGRFTIDFNESPVSSKGSTRIDHVEVGVLVAQTKARDNISGRLSGDIELSYRGATWAEIKKSVDGRANLSLVEGRIPGLNILEDIADILNVSPSVLGIKPGEPFDEFSGNWTLKKGKIRSDDLFITQKGASLSAKGSLSLDGELDLTVIAKLGPEMSSVIPLPLGLGETFFKNRRVGLLVPFKLTGPLSDPKVISDVNTLGRLATQDLLKNPLEWLQSPFDGLLGGDEEESSDRK